MAWMIFIFSLFTSAKQDPNPWGKISAPIPAESSQIYGSYTAGCLSNAETLPLDGIGYEVVNPYRNRNHAHASLARLIKNLGMWAASHKIGKIVVGDIAQPAGGPLTGAHKSHQVGLDADIRLHVLPPDKKINNRNDFNSTDVVSCQVKKKDNAIKYNFHDSKWPMSSTQLLRKIASEDSVERIFVSAGIKKHLCESFPDHPEWLRKIRPEWGHTSHLHVRLRCPMGMPTCDGQSPVIRDATDPTTVGCAGVDFQSWFKTNNKKIAYDCIPKSPADDMPYWQKVVTSEKFPKECQDLLKAKALPVKETQTTSIDSINGTESTSATTL